ncbi:leucyl aminopeptidase family protein [Pluralibacter gergoviae]|uniref:leucyl aminopeptidase family protein n=1 Tax=Pluralibacter gergoviae TaxID=61647 RepID=UPI000BFE9DA9|nr:leucyl aminopeptidase family protein [Pluralibacter gergoviae]MCK1067538.1 leucyl aminopeptidase family protein [Pluralibacter gergoviae]MCV7760133.1 leucyl aminopeptidase family protein [Pluralibacter gergoviae]PHH46361.1 leucyl aminopeptidase [Pluralibacter gergoviae]HDS1238849.1 leucyl aminopeptidase family protein [Pluralibacter gergoviae]HDS1240381.1 leucyl aminopeptidase family protein [Pluralibacter gergoviae]
MDYQLITRPAQIPAGSHLISWPGSPLLDALDVPLLAEMRAAGEGDARFGCAPFARITLIPQEAWQERATDALPVRLRALLKAPVSDTLVLDCTLLAAGGVRDGALRALFNLDHRLSDLKLMTSCPQERRVAALFAYCLPQQEASLAESLRLQHAVAAGMLAARRLADLPADLCTPQFVVEQATRLTADSPALRCEVLDEAAIREQGLGLLHAVGKGAGCPPRLLAIHYDGTSVGPVRSYVGKGVTFDTGGLWLKEGAGMYTMKYDMCGAANVLGLMLSIARLALPVRAMGVLALAENAIGPNAMQPGSVARACNGMTIEINNTDAEGRLVLADAIAWASRRHPQSRYIIDIATLTGAVVKALGYDLSGLMTQDEGLRAALTAAGLKSGDEVWSLPLDARLKPQTASRIADLCNTPTNNAAISASAAWLLHHFCPPEIPWAHLDVSGTALWREEGHSVASGRPIPLLVQHLLDDLGGEVGFVEAGSDS